jgi:iron complex outermembrane recepter protein
MRRPIVILLTYFFFNIISSIHAQKIIEGRVYDAETSKPLAGVLIFAKNTVKTTKSDPSGNYRLIIPEKANTLIFNLTGYAKQEVDIKGINTLEVGLRNFFSRETENVIVIGTRDATRKKNDNYAAIDIIPVADIVKHTGHIELSQLLHFYAPSFNANRQTGADLADHVDPISVRGLGPDQVLFLVNGKRFLRSAVINVFGTKGRGNVSSDINTIPVSTIERIEVLKDGAAAQYGSDAIAGVVNIVLKAQIAGTNGSIISGTNSTGYGKTLNYQGKKVLPSITDGLTTNANATHGFKIGECLMTVTGDLYARKATKRPNNDALFPDKNYRQEFGDAALSAQNLYFNGRYPLKNAEIYAFGGYHHRNTDAAIWTVSPEDTARSVHEIFPNGYNPHLETNINNYYFVMGTKSKVKSWDFDLSYSLGKNKIRMATSSTLNPSLRASSPTNFDNGQYQFGQFLLNCDMSRKYTKVMKGLNVAFGAEHRFLNYRIVAGEDASWKNYLIKPLIVKQPNGRVDTIRKIGTSQGYPGVSSADALDVYRSQYAIYSDAELTMNAKLMLAGALRYEVYSDFASAVGSRLALRYKPTPQYSVRLSMQTGFRAPSLAQIYFRSTINDVDTKGESFEKIIFNNQSVLAKKLNVPSLKVEKSLNLSAGFNYIPNNNWVFTTDFYRIIVRNRIILSGEIEQNDLIIGTDLKKQNVKQAQFYINALQTTSYGLDLLATYKKTIGKTQLDMTLGGNINRFPITDTQVDEKYKGNVSDLSTLREQQFIKSAAPNSKVHAIFNIAKNKSNLNLHLSYFGKTTHMSLDEDNGIFLFYKPRIQTDISYGLSLGKKIEWAIGAKNIFDVYPTIQSPDLTDSGGQWEGVQNGFSGAFFFSRLNWRF